MNWLWLLVYNLFFNPVIAFPIFLLFLPVRKVRETLARHLGVWERLAVVRQDAGTRPLIWFHVSSAGEYLMAKPVIDLFSKKKVKVFVSITSISAYRWLKREAPSSFSFDFMPLDFIQNSLRVINLMRPSAVVFVRNDIWPNLRFAAQRKGIPVFFAGAPERETDSGLKRMFYRFLYSGFHTVFTITPEAQKFHQLLNPLSRVVFSGDTKYDIVLARKKERKIRLHGAGSPCLVLGSVWPEDLDVILPGILKALEKHKTLSLVIAPHEVSSRNIHHVMFLFEKYRPLLYSSLTKKPAKFRVMIVDTIGDLFYIYGNSLIAYVGGGFGAGIHNIIEPAAMGNTVIFGPRHYKFPEAQTQISRGTGFSIEDRESFEDVLFMLLKNTARTRNLGSSNARLAVDNAGATTIIFKAIWQSLSLK